MGHREKLSRERIEAAGAGGADVYFLPSKEDAKLAKKHIAWLAKEGLKPSAILLMVSRREAVPENALDAVRKADFDNYGND